MLFGRHPEAPAPRFRILIIGNANAGKTTILKNVCCGNSEVELEPSIRRGEHDIETEIMYPTDFGFVFHDSMGFEAGTATELKEVERFLASRAQKEQLKDRVHAIWYCLSTSGDRSMTEAEMSFFHMNTGDVPIIVIFTKVDTLERKAFNKLLRQGVPFSDAKREAPAEAEAAFQRDYFKQLEHYLQGNERTSAPVRIMQLRDMNKDGADTKELLACTAASLDRDALRLLMYSVLRNDVRRRVETSITSIVIYDARVAMEKNAFTEQQQLYLLSSILLLFPHILV
ncbi:hypothetical protein C8J57DRAFT_1277312 [Mycena rebaudengoi]|nr:hypothetical protein C8J57DRAFT_1277312 [Mycena rebaudengoi]